MRPCDPSTKKVSEIDDGQEKESWATAPGSSWQLGQLGVV